MVCISSPAFDAFRVEFHTRTHGGSGSTPLFSIRWHILNQAFHSAKERKQNEHQDLTQLFSVLSYFILHIHSVPIPPIIISRRDEKERSAPPCDYLQIHMPPSGRGDAVSQR